MPNNNSITANTASFRDPSGFIFKFGPTIYRQINTSYASTYDQFMESGLYTELSVAQLLVSHKEVASPKAIPEIAYKIIQPDLIPFISYPYEWSFNQLKDAALLTLSIQRLALARDFSLKDASVYNVQFIGCRPIFIDTLSFEQYSDGKPWVAYRQFCQHFLAPLALMSYVDLRFGTLSRDYIDGLPLDLAAKLMPGSAKLNFGLATHLFLHAGSQQRLAGSQRSAKEYRLAKPALLGLIDSLTKTVQGLKMPVQKTTWGNYYEDTNYSSKARAEKEKIILNWLTIIQPNITHDLGANAGDFSRVAAKKSGLVISSDIDPIAVDSNYLQAAADKSAKILPLIIDLTNPSPAIGWANAERESFFERSHADVNLCLALIHHLAIANNVPLPMLAKTLHQLGPNLIIEFITKEDSNVKRLLASREDIFTEYNQTGFEKAFGQFFTTKDKKILDGKERILYWLQAK